LPRTALPDPGEEEYYHADLIGLRVVVKDGGSFGVVKAVHDFGAGDSLEIERPGGVVVLVPFTSTTVPAVDIAEGRLVLDLPEGLLDNRPVEVTERDAEG
jgi:16S rRNA processing protein RimM